MSKELALKAIELLTPIAKEDFITSLFTNETDKCCAIGHLTRLESYNPNNYAIYNCSDDDNAKYRRIRLNRYNIAGVNNSRTELYQQDNPKDRVLAFLNDYANSVN